MSHFAGMVVMFKDDADRAYSEAVVRVIKSSNVVVSVQPVAATEERGTVGMVVMFKADAAPEDVLSLVVVIGALPGINPIQTIDAAANTDQSVAGREVLRILDAIKEIYNGGK